MKKSYDLLKAINANVSYDLKGSYKKLGGKRSFSSLNKIPSEIAGTYSTEWSFQSFKTSASVSTASTLPSQVSPVKYDQRLSLLQELNQALDKGEDEFMKVFCLSQLPREDFKQEKKQIKSKNILKLFSKFFTRDQEDIVNQEFESELKMSIHANSFKMK